MLLTRFFIAVVFAFLIAVPQAYADYNVWRDVHSGMSFSFPDTWDIVSNADDNDVVTVMPPSGRAQATCRVRNDKDKRYLIYPPRHSAAIQKLDFSADFWDRYLAEFTNPNVVHVYDGAGLGRGFASYAEADYTSAVEGPEMKRRAIMFVSLYNGDLFVLECSSHQDAYEEWRDAFLSIAKSVDFKKAHEQMIGGHYRNFRNDRDVEFSDPKEKYITRY